MNVSPHAAALAAITAVAAALTACAFEDEKSGATDPDGSAAVELAAGRPLVCAERP